MKTQNKMNIWTPRIGNRGTEAPIVHGLIVVPERR
jgi:hypothetical protein